MSTHIFAVTGCEKGLRSALHREIPRAEGSITEDGGWHEPPDQTEGHEDRGVGTEGDAAR